MTPKISLAIQHASFSEERAVMLMDLFKALGGVQEILPRTERFTVVKDTDRDGVWPTARRAWLEAAHSASTHHIVLQDDAIPCRGFLDAAVLAIESVPDNPISYFDMSNATTKALDNGKHWATRRSLSTALAISMPSVMALNGLRWISANVKPDARHDDDRWSLYFLANNIEVWYTAPSLVEHGGWSKSLLGNPMLLPKGRRRVAAAMISRLDDAKQIDWTAGVERPYRGWSHPIKEYENLLIRPLVKGTLLR